MAIMIATVMVAAGLSVAPPAAAGHDNCHKDFDIQNSEPADSDARVLLIGASEVGREKVTASGGDETLNVELVSGDEIEWTVFEEDANNNCVEYTDGGCDGPNTITTVGSTQTCTLEAPSSGSMSYWVLSENTGSELAEYKTWVS